MADLAKIAEEQYAPDQIFDVELVGPDGAGLFNDDGTPMTIGIVGEDSDEAIARRNATTNRRIQQGARAKITAEGLISENAAHLAKISKRWNITLGGEKPEFSEAAVAAVYRNTKLAFVLEAVKAAHEERSNFLKRSA